VFCESYLQTMIDGAESVRLLLPEISQAAESAASRLIGGGDLYIASSRPDFMSEGYVRSGGMMMMQECTSSTPKQGDVVIAGWSDTESDADRRLISRLVETGAFVIGIGPEAKQFSRNLDVFLHSDPPCPEIVLGHLNNESYPLISLQNLILLWTFTAELVAAMTREGQMPVMYQSVLTEGARERNTSFGSHRFHATHDVPSISPGRLGGAYLDRISTCLTSLHHEAPAVARAAAAAVEVLKNDRHIHAFLIAHFPVHQAGAPGDPGYMTTLDTFTGETPDVAELERKLGPGDLFFFLGYYRRPNAAYEVARRRQCTIVEIIAGAREPASVGHEPDYKIDPGWEYTDSLVDVPGYDVRILPASGILQAAVYWSVIGQITERLGASETN
jgi:hypothetical protein